MEEVGHRTFGVVYRAVDKETCEVVAVKKLMTNLNQAMPQQEKPFSETAIRYLCFQILQDLAYMHHKGYFHRDLKPDNLLVNNDAIKIADLGSARSVSSSLATPIGGMMATRRETRIEDQKEAKPPLPRPKDIKMGVIIGRGTERLGLYHVDEVTRSGTVILSHGIAEQEAWLWHRRLGHPSTGYLHALFPKLFPSNYTPVEQNEHMKEQENFPTHEDTSETYALPPIANRGVPLKRHGVLFKQNGHLETQLYTDAYWAGDKGDPRSTSGYFTLVGGNLVTWRSKKQKVVALSSAEVEFRGIGRGITEVLWIPKLITEIGYPPQEPSKVMSDNKAAIQILENLVQHDRTKNIEIDRHFIKEKLEAEIITLLFVWSQDQVIDILTEAVNERTLHECLGKLNFGNLTIKLEGEC
uniref:Putative copia-type protein n=1 Tax=Tanacetum cinerariifolium TaxID=118510 RepID=A0A6L2JC73_TANCI|nr:putative copia-type protein [Tanacetum cinerariifolium]